MRIERNNTYREARRWLFMWSSLFLFALITMVVMLMYNAGILGVLVSALFVISFVEMMTLSDKIIQVRDLYEKLEKQG